MQYYSRVMRLFEQVPSPSYVIRVAKTATKLVNSEHPNAVSLELACISGRRERERERERERRRA